MKLKMMLLMLSATEEGKKVLTKLHKALRVNKLPSDTISIYKQKVGDPEFDSKL